MVTFIPYLYSRWRSWRSNLGGFPPKKPSRATLNFAFLNFCLVTTKIHYFEFYYLEFSRKIVNVSFRILQNISLKFKDKFPQILFTLLFHNTATTHPWFHWFWQCNSLQMSISVLIPRNALTRRQYHPMNRKLLNWDLQSQTEKFGENIMVWT